MNERRIKRLRPPVEHIRNMPLSVKRIPTDPNWAIAYDDVTHRDTAGPPPL
jgi:hypothetical protein